MNQKYFEMRENIEFHIYFMHLKYDCSFRIENSCQQLITYHIANITFLHLFLKLQAFQK